MKKVSILSLHLGYGGIEKCVVALANLLANNYEVEIAVSYKLYDRCAFNIDKRVKVIYLTEDISPNKDELRLAIKSMNPINIIKEGFTSLKVLYLRRSTMVKYIKTCKSDVIISTRDIFDNWLGKYKDKSTLSIGWEHNHYHGNMKYAKKIIKYASKLDYLVLVSKELKDYYKKELQNTYCLCVNIPNIVDSIPKYTSKLNSKKLVSVGRLSPEKGFLDLVKIFNILHKKYPDWTLDIIGDGSEKDKINDYIKENKLSKSVKLHGFRNKDYIDEILHNSSIYLMTSYTESFGIVLIEAMSHGIPCIAFSSAEGACEIINDNVNGYLVDNRNYEEYIKKIINLIENKEKRDILGASARETSLNYTEDKVSEYWFKLIEGDINEE